MDICWIILLISASRRARLRLASSNASRNHWFPRHRRSPPGTNSWSSFTEGGICFSIDFRRSLGCWRDWPKDMLRWHQGDLTSYKNKDKALSLRGEVFQLGPRVRQRRFHGFTRLDATGILYNKHHDYQPRFLFIVANLPFLCLMYYLMEGWVPLQAHDPWSSIIHCSMFFIWAAGPWKSEQGLSSPIKGQSAHSQHIPSIGSQLLWL